VPRIPKFFHDGRPRGCHRGAAANRRPPGQSLWATGRSPSHALVPNLVPSQYRTINRFRPIFETKSTADDQERPRTNKFRNAPLGTVVVTHDRSVPSRVHLRSGALWALSPDDLCARCDVGPMAVRTEKPPGRRTKGIPIFEATPAVVANILRASPAGGDHSENAAQSSRAAPRATKTTQSSN
jgi:hypothetical protein